MFGYVRPYKSELLVREYEQYKAMYCQLCRVLGKEYGWALRFSLSYDCTFYAMLAMAVSGSGVSECSGRCGANPMKKCRYLTSSGEEYKKAAALSVLLTYYKLEDDRDDEGFWKSLGCRILLRFVSPKRKKAARNYPFLEKCAKEAVDGQREAEKNREGVDACAEPTAHMLSELFSELAGDNAGQRAALKEFGYYMGRWVYLMDAADDLKKDGEEGKFNPFLTRLGISGKQTLSSEDQANLEKDCNRVLNATVARMLPPLNLISMERFGPIVENVAQKGFPELQREILFLHVRERRKRRGKPD